MLSIRSKKRAKKGILCKLFYIKRLCNYLEMAIWLKYEQYVKMLVLGDYLLSESTFLWNFKRVIEMAQRGTLILQGKRFE